MFRSIIIIVLVSGLVSAVLLTGCKQEMKRDYPYQPVPFTHVHIMDDFWAPKMETNRTVTIPFAMQQNRDTGRVENFAIAAGLEEGTYQGERYNDTDVYKVMEGAAYTLATYPDPELEAELDELIDLIAAAQEEDGYLFTPRTAAAGKSERPMGIGETRWSNLAVSHELYNAGHMYEAAAAHYRATGKRNFLDIAVKNADLLVRTFGPEKIKAFPGHQEVEIGLVKLYRVTGKKEYLDLAGFFLEQRGQDGLGLKQYPQDHRFSIYNDPVQIQAHKPVLEQEEAVGHAVRATYMFSSMADVAALTGAEDYIQAIDRLWQNVVSKKMALTGGLGARHDRERFGDNYELPNLTSYNETCASIGSVFWNHRQFLLHGHGKYIDVMERTLYNGVIVGVSLEGNTFFYPNPLASDAAYKFNKGAACRQPWFGVACCPGNIARFLPSIPGYIYAVRNRELYINLYTAGTGEIDLEGRSVKINQETNYPWDGQVKINLEPESPDTFAVMVRIPGWARSQPVPSDLYTYIGEENDSLVISVNGEALDAMIEKGYIRIEREWTPGDEINVTLPMPVRKLKSHPEVEADQEKIAIERGPLVYCAEGHDNQGHALDLMIPEETVFKADFRPDFLDGVMVLQGQGFYPEGNRTESLQVTLIPYYTWANRGPVEMSVWFHRYKMELSGN